MAIKHINTGQRSIKDPVNAFSGLRRGIEAFTASDFMKKRRLKKLDKLEHRLVVWEARRMVYDAVANLSQEPCDRDTYSTKSARSKEMISKLMAEHSKHLHKMSRRGEL